MDLPSWLLPLTGLLCGIGLGFVARKNFFCTLTSLEQYWYGDNASGVRTWALAAVVACIVTQGAIAGGVIDVSSSFYINANFGWLAAIVGGLTFGFGMALVGTCGYGALVRLGGGSLKSFTAVMVLALVAMSVQRGLLSFSRTDLFDHFHVTFELAGSQSIPELYGTYLSQSSAWLVAPAIIAIVLLWIFSDPDFRSNYSAIFTGAAIGLLVSAGWFVTTYFEANSFDLVQVEAASFIAPVADTAVSFILLSGGFPDYGVGVVIGTVLGSNIAARLADDIRWEACDDARELNRHIVGAALMGVGGVLAVGCTIGQGVSAASMLAVSVPVTMTCILIGARLGLSWLLEGSVFSFLGRPTAR